MFRSSAKESDKTGETGTKSSWISFLLSYRFEIYKVLVLVSLYYLVYHHVIERLEYRLSMFVSLLSLLSFWTFEYLMFSDSGKQEICSFWNSLLESCLLNLK
jgi:hypothetical protein